MNKFIWSLDISTTNIGCALWDINGKLIELKHLVLKTPKELNPLFRDLYKADIFENYCNNYLEYITNELDGKIINIVVEEPLGGSNNAKTVSLLEGFNGMCRYVLRKTFNVFIYKISVHDSRKIFCPELVFKKKSKGKIIEVLSFPKAFIDKKKEYIFNKVSKIEKSVNWICDKNGKISQKSYDMSDAYCVGYSGIKLFNLLNE